MLLRLSSMLEFKNHIQALLAHLFFFSSPVYVEIIPILCLRKLEVR